MNFDLIIFFLLFIGIMMAALGWFCYCQVGIILKDDLLWKPVQLVISMV